MSEPRIRPTTLFLFFAYNSSDNSDGQTGLGTTVTTSKQVEGIFKSYIKEKIKRTVTIELI